jgi:CheY-like chemotaxis protein
MTSTCRIILPIHGGNGTGRQDFPDLSGLTLVLVDDEEDSLYVTAQLLQACHATVLTAMNGSEALGLLAAQIPDAILTDLSMPVMDGVELLRHLRSVPVTRNVPVLALTAFAEHYMDGADEFDAFFRKPFNLDAMCATILRLAAVQGDSNAA